MKSTKVFFSLTILSTLLYSTVAYADISDYHANLTTNVTISSSWSKLNPGTSLDLSACANDSKNDFRSFDCGSEVVNVPSPSNPQSASYTLSNTNGQYLFPGLDFVSSNNVNEIINLDSTAIDTSCQSFFTPITFLLSSPTFSGSTYATKFLNEATDEARNYTFNVTLNFLNYAIANRNAVINISVSDCSLSGPN